MDKRIFSQSRFGKYIISQKKWDALKCEDCGCRMKLEEEDKFEAIKICPRCGKRKLLVKPVRKEQIRGEII